MTCRQARRILGLPKGATLDEIRARFYERAKVTHPDATGTSDATEFLQARAAFETLLHCLEGIQPEEANAAIQTADTTFEDGEWGTIENALKAAIEQLRHEWLEKPLVSGLIQRLNAKVDSYSSANDLRRSLRNDIPKVVTTYLIELNRQLRNDIRSVAGIFNRHVTELYFPLFERVHRVRLTQLSREPVFLFSALFSATALLITVALAPNPPPGSLAAAALGGIPVGYLISRMILRRPPGIVTQLEVPAIRDVVMGLDSPGSLAKEDLIQGGFLLALADWLDFDLGFEELELVGLAVMGLALLFGKSLDRIKADTKAEIEEKTRAAIDFKKELNELFDLYWQRLATDGRQEYARQRRTAIEYTKGYGGRW